MEVDTQGDSFFAVFRMASDAVAAALAAQRSLAAQAWPSAGAVRVRIGLHTGEAIARGDHYVGQEIHRASRICDAGHGGQIVVSQTTAELVRGSLPDGATLAPLGDYRLKDLGQPQRLFQLGATGLASDFPRLRSLDIPTNLPTERSSFIGREADISAIRERLAEHRLVTLTGIGGSGKTRLALQVGALELGNFADGVFFVDLAPVSDAELVAATMAGACGLLLGEGPGLSGVSLDDRLVAALARRKSLLIVDNCEHLVEAVADLLDRILAECADDQPARDQPRGAGRRGRADRAGAVARAARRCRAEPGPGGGPRRRAPVRRARRARSSPASRSAPRTAPRWSTSAAGSTASRWPSSLRRRAWRTCRCRRLPSGWKTASACSLAGGGASSASRRCRRRSTGATTC